MLNDFITFLSISGYYIGLVIVALAGIAIVILIVYGMYDITVNEPKRRKEQLNRCRVLAKKFSPSMVVSIGSRQYFLSVYSNETLQQNTCIVENVSGERLMLVWNEELPVVGDVWTLRYSSEYGVALDKKQKSK